MAIFHENTFNTMKRFRINSQNEINIFIRHKGELIIRSVYEKGFNSLPETINYAKSLLDFRHKNKGYKIEIGIFNLTTNKEKYINTFS